MVIRKYHKLNFKTYEPKKKVKIRKAEAIPVAIDVGRNFSGLGGLTGFFISSFLMSIKSFFNAKRKINRIKIKYGKTIDLRG